MRRCIVVPVVELVVHLGNEIIGDEVRVKAGANIDFETAKTHDITIEATDSGGNTYAETLNINVNNINEGPTDIEFNQDGQSISNALSVNDGAIIEFAAASNFNDFPNSQITFEIQFATDAPASSVALASYAVSGSGNEFFLLVNVIGSFGVFIINVVINTIVQMAFLFACYPPQLSLSWDSSYG